MFPPNTEHPPLSTPIDRHYNAPMHEDGAVHPTRPARPERLQLVPELGFAAMALACVALGWAYIWPGYLDHLASDEFLPTPCRVVESRVYRASDMVSWTYDLRYEYVVDGVTHESSRLGFVTARSTRSTPPVPPPGPNTCYVRKGHPDRSVLLKRIDPSTGPIALGLIIACLLFIWSAFQLRRIRLRNASRME